MKYVRVGGKILLSLERGEELCGTLRMLAAEEDIKFALVSAHGQCRSATLGSYDSSLGTVFEYTYQGFDYELVSVTGELTNDAEPKLSLHASISFTKMRSTHLDHPGTIYGGLLSSATISSGCTVVLELLDVGAKLVPVESSSEAPDWRNRLLSTFTSTDEVDRKYLKLELE